jgi:nitronate monooxygenase
VKGKNFWVTRGDLLRAREWALSGFDSALKTPDNTLVFVDSAEKAVIRKDQADCMGCLSQCAFSSWMDSETNSTGRSPIRAASASRRRLQDIAHGGDPDQNLMFAGHGAYKFGKDPFYSNGFVPTVKQLVDRILTGD